MKEIHYLLIAVSMFTVACGGNGLDPDKPDGGDKPEEKTYLPDWQEGYLDIHHIATGKGDCVFVVMPDGTTMIQDAGDCADSYGASGCDPLPDDSKTVGEWIADYVNCFTAKLPSPGTLDYAWLTHFHGDHVGTTTNGKAGPNGYYLSGITMVGEKVKINKLVDRDYPSYNFPSEAKVKSEFGGFYEDYKMFIQHQQKLGMEAEKFVIGRNDQFKLVHNAAAYPEFEIRNLCSNGQIWTGKGTATKKMYSGDISLFDENMNSCAIKMVYGKFSYFNGGDLPGSNHAQYPSQERTFEIPVSELAGPVTALTPNHHGWKESTTSTFLKNMKPQVIVVMSSHVEHPYSATLQNMTSELVWEGDRELYITSENPRQKLGNSFNKFKAAGHVVIRVYKGGSAYQTFVLDARQKDYPVIYQSTIKYLEK